MVTIICASKHVTKHVSFKVNNYGTCYQKMDYSQWCVFDKHTSVVIAQKCVWPAQCVNYRPLVYAVVALVICVVPTMPSVCASYSFIFIAVRKGAPSGSDYKRRMITN